MNAEEFFQPKKRKKTGRRKWDDNREAKTARVNTSITEGQLRKLRIIAAVQENSTSDTLGLIIDRVFEEYIFSCAQDYHKAHDVDLALILESLLYNLEYDLISHNEIMGCICISGSDGWMYSGSDNYEISKYFPCCNRFSFSAEITLCGQWRGETSILGTSIIATISGEAEGTPEGWRVAEWELTEFRMYPIDGEEEYPLDEEHH